MLNVEETWPAPAITGLFFLANFLLLPVMLPTLNRLSALPLAPWDASLTSDNETSV